MNTINHAARKREWADHIVAQMASFGPVLAKPMFGGFGMYRQGLMFALLFDGRLYFKVDALCVGDFTARGLGPFTYESKGKTGALRYHEAPAEVFDDLDAMALWARRAYDCALRAQAPKQPKPSFFQRTLADVPNLGPASQAMLCKAGIADFAALQALGAVRAYVQTKAACPKASLNLLWALEGALSGRTWQDVAAHDRASLLMALEDAQALAKD